MRRCQYIVQGLFPKKGSLGGGRDAGKRSMSKTSIAPRPAIRLFFKHADQKAWPFRRIGPPGATREINQGPLAHSSPAPQNTRAGAVRVLTTKWIVRLLIVMARFRKLVLGNPELRPRLWRQRGVMFLGSKAIRFIPMRCSQSAANCDPIRPKSQNAKGLSKRTDTWPTVLLPGPAGSDGQCSPSRICRAEAPRSQRPR